MASIRRPIILTFILIFGSGLAALSPALFAVAGDRNAPPSSGQEDGSVLRIPGLPPIQMPPGQHAYGPEQTVGPDEQDGSQRERPFNPYRNFGTQSAPDGRGRPNDYGTVIGPGGVVKPMAPPPRRAEAPKKKVLTPEERAASIRKALMPKPPLAFARRHTLDDLYGKLAAASDEDEAKGLATLIANIWMRSGSDTSNLLMQRASVAMEHKDYALATSLLDKIVALQPTWAEAWNRRATVRFLAGDLDGSMADVEHVLKLEPNHFGALEGMAMILERTGLDKQALSVYRRVLAIYPQQPALKDKVDKLTLQVEGQGI